MRSRLNDLPQAGKFLPSPSQYRSELKGLLTIFRATVRSVICLLIAYEVFFCSKSISATSFYVDAICIAIVTMTTVRYGGLVSKTVSVEHYTGRFVFEGLIPVVVLMSDAVNYMATLW